MCVKEWVFHHELCQNLTLSHALTDILTQVLNMTLIDGDKNKQQEWLRGFEVRWKRVTTRIRKIHQSRDGHYAPFFHAID